MIVIIQIIVCCGYLINGCSSDEEFKELYKIAEEEISYAVITFHVIRLLIINIGQYDLGYWFPHLTRANENFVSVFQQCWRMKTYAVDKSIGRIVAEAETVSDNDDGYRNSLW